MINTRHIILGILSLFLIGSCGNSEMDTDTISEPKLGSSSIGLIDDNRIIEAESEPGNWLAFGRTYEEQRFSPLTKINKETVHAEALEWSMTRGSRSGRVAYQYIQDLAGRLGKKIN